MVDPVPKRRPSIRWLTGRSIARPRSPLRERPKSSHGLVGVRVCSAGGYLLTPGGSARSTALLHIHLAPPAWSIGHVPCPRRCQEQQHRGSVLEQRHRQDERWWPHKRCTSLPVRDMIRLLAGAMLARAVALSLRGLGTLWLVGIGFCLLGVLLQDKAQIGRQFPTIAIGQSLQCRFHGRRHADRNGLGHLLFLSHSASIFRLALYWSRYKIKVTNRGGPS
jgi:hypothetical protein